MSTAGASAPGRPRTGRRTVGAALVPGRRARTWLALLGAVAALVAAAYLVWLRDSSLFEVRKVTITGLAGSDSGRIRAALTGTARAMTTLNVDRRRLERAASAFPAVRAIEIDADFPHAMRIHVIEHVPVALLASGSRRTAVAADGTVLPGLPAARALPLIRIPGGIRSRRVRGRDLARVRVAGGIPAALRGRVDEVALERGRGVVALLRDGPRLIFGDGTSVAAKWAAAAGVLADEAAAGAAYVDVRIAARPAAGGLPVETSAPVAPAPAPVAGAAGPGAAPPPAAPQGAPPPAGPAPRAPAAGQPVAGDPAAPAMAPQTPVTQGGGAAPNPRP